MLGITRNVFCQVTCRRLLIAAATLASLAWAPMAEAACVTIGTAAELDNIRNDLAGEYCLANNIDLGSIADFTPIGTFATPFSGKLFGNGHAIANLTANTGGLFGSTFGAVIQDLRLVNSNVGPTGILVVGPIYTGVALGGLVALADSSTITRVIVSGRINLSADGCAGGGCYVGGIVGILHGGTLSESSSAATVTGGMGYLGGLVGDMHAKAGIEPVLSRSYFTGSITCNNVEWCTVGGLVGSNGGGSAVSVNPNDLFGGTIELSYAAESASVGSGNYSDTGGLVGILTAGTVRQSYSAGKVTVGNGANGAGGLIGSVYWGNPTPHSVISETYAIGRITQSGGIGGALGGLFGWFEDDPGTVTNSYWDTQTSAMVNASGGGVGCCAPGATAMTTSQLQAELPPGFDPAVWAITPGSSYPYLRDPAINLRSPLSTLVQRKKAYVWLPIGQLDKSQYLTKPAHADGASLATVYTMIARAIGITRNIKLLKRVKIDTYFWNDAAIRATWQGPVTTYASLGTRIRLSPSTPLNDANVIGQLKQRKLVILRGTYTKNAGVKAIHWLLATLFTTKPDGALRRVIAHDPRTGRQIEIDPITKKVVKPARFPLKEFVVDRYQAVTVN
ncbi:MAG: hypothetical protein ACT4SY_11210 [Hyphomicrobiales bacterium]